jgi:hypothetical protein
MESDLQASTDWLKKSECEDWSGSYLEGTGNRIFTVRDLKYWGLESGDLPGKEKVGLRIKCQ